MSLRLISFLILLGTMPVCSVCAQCEGHTYNENGFCTCGSLTCTSYEAATDSDSDGYYEISNAGNLYWFAAYVNSSSSNTSANAKLTANITVNEDVLVNGELNTNTDIVNNFRVWTPIGASNYYNGTFDGNRHTISGLYFNGGAEYAGLFGRTNGTIKNLGVEDSYFKASHYVGSIAGRNGEGYGNGTITNCYSQSRVEGNGYEYERIGGIVGYNVSGTITYCYNTGKISGTYKTYIGGVVGHNTTNSNVSNCYCLDSSATNAIGGGTGNAVNVSSKTSTQFASGEVAYLLNGSTYQGELTWGQNIDNGQTPQDYPVLGGATVYAVECSLVYHCSNSVDVTDDGYVNGICTNCGAYQPATLNDNDTQDVTTDDYFEIANAGNLYWFAEHANSSSDNSSANAKLLTNITVNQNVLVEGNLNSNHDSFKQWTPIGNSSSQYSGIFDGQKYTISGLYFNDNTKGYVGLFGSINNAQIRNLGVVDSYINAASSVGGIVGEVYGTGTVENCYNTSLVIGTENVGGIAGNNAGSVLNSYNIGPVTGTSNACGIVGNNNNTGTVTNCYYLYGTTEDANATQKTSAQFASGEVAYLLNGSTCQGELTWGQNIDNGETPQDYPVLGGATVYAVKTNCSLGYHCSNSDNVIAGGYVNGICTVCGVYQPARLRYEYYEINNAGNLYWFAEHVNSSDNSSANAKLLTNITVNQNVLVEGNLNSNHDSFKQWTPIGNSSSQYSGIFDGQKYTISGLYFNDDSEEDVGLFGSINNAQIINLGVVDSYFKAASSVGGIVGEVNAYGTVENCYNTSSVIGTENVGGIAGNNAGSVSNCYNTGSFTGTSSGAVVGNNAGFVKNSFFNKDGNNGNAVGLNTNFGIIDDKTCGKTTAQFNSGEVACLLQAEQETQVWGQNIDNEKERQNYPVLSDARVYKWETNACECSYYSNKPYNGICSCGHIDVPKYNEDGGYYEIANAGNLYWFANYVNAGNTSANAVLVDNVFDNQNVLVGDELNTNTEIVNNFRVWTPIIGSSENQYSGTFDGQKYTISGLYFNDNTKGYVGLFGSINNAQIINLGVVDSYFNAGSSVGGVVGEVYGSGKVEKCYNTCLVIGTENVGGIAGKVNASGTVNNCYNTFLIRGTVNFGGIAGNNAGSVSNCYNIGYVTDKNTSTDSAAGDVVGNNAGLVKNCYDEYPSVGGGEPSTTIGINNGNVVDVLSLASDRFECGEVADLLQGEQETQVWGQNMSIGQLLLYPRQTHPVFSDARVYKCETNACREDYHRTIYLNTPSNGICWFCGGIDVPICNDTNYYEIANAGNLYWFATLVNGGTINGSVIQQNRSANAVLVDDIVDNLYVLNEDGYLRTSPISPSISIAELRRWTPMGSEGQPYIGHFEGNGHTISGLYFEKKPDELCDVGLFARTSSGAKINNLGIVDSYFKGSTVGSIVGTSQGATTIENCYNAGSVFGDGYVGGIVGSDYSNGLKVENCCNSGLVEYTSTTNFPAVGGIIGSINYKDTELFKNNYYIKDENGINSDIYGFGRVVLDDGTRVVSKSTAEFASGEVAYMLQNGVTAPNENEVAPQIWGQNIDNQESLQNKQDYPVLSAARVYRTGVKSYSNTDVNNNECGDNVFWSLDNGILRISGTGEITSTPWLNENVTTVLVYGDITKIPNGAFTQGGITSVYFYGTSAPQYSETNNSTRSSNGMPSVFAPCIWESFEDFSVNNLTKMPTYTYRIKDLAPNTLEKYWAMPTTAKSTEPSSTDHVVINTSLTIANGKSLTVKSFGLTENGSLTIEDGGQFTCQQAHGEVTVEKNIIGDELVPQWYTISSPLKGNVAATSVANMITKGENTYALYCYDEQNYQWQNYKLATNNFTNLDAGRGYLYANKNDVSLTFTDEINTESVKCQLTAQGEYLTGINLIGNPFTHNITFNNLSVSTGQLAEGYYVLSNQGAWAAEPSTTGDIKPGQGLLIKTDATGTLTINPNTTTNVAKGQQPRANSQEPMLSLNLSNGNYSDRAFVIFSEGVGLDKINHENKDIPLLYIPMSDTDYAIAMMDESVNEIPVGFESSSMGEFTISLRQENCEFEELYLLDKETGAKVNILEEDYTFMAMSGDDPERFTLIKDNGQQTTDNSHFAYINNGDVVIYGAEGNAQIDIYDVLGRHVYNANGSDDVHILTTDGYSAGVYVIRLMDEKGVRTQKVVIE